MQVSAEVRWFTGEHEIAAATKDWFKSESNFDHVIGGGRDRIDIYLADSPEIGIKLREGKAGLEVKSLVEGRVIEVPFAEVKACVQLWTKVSSKSLDFSQQSEPVIR